MADKEVLEVVEFILNSHDVKFRGDILKIFENALLIESEKVIGLLLLHSKTLTKY